MLLSMLIILIVIGGLAVIGLLFALKMILDHKGDLDLQMDLRKGLLNVKKKK